VGKQSKPRKLAENEAVAVGNMLRGSPQKLNLVAETIRGQPVEKAITALSFNRRAASRQVKKVLESAVANAENNHNLDVDQLVVAEASVGKSLVMRRFRARARGGVGRLAKPFSRLRIVVREVEES